VVLQEEGEVKMRRRIQISDFSFLPQTLDIFDRWDENGRWLGVAKDGSLWIVWKQDCSSVYRYSHLNLMRSNV
jgi:hypothetical protein